MTWPTTDDRRTPAHRHRANREGTVTPQFNGKFAVNTKAEITRFHSCDRIDSAHAIHNSQRRATDVFLISQEYRND
jgi:hypothetical protein